MALTLTALRQKITDDLADFSNIVPDKIRGVDNEIINVIEEIMTKYLPLQSGFISGLNVDTGITGFGGDIIGAVHTVGPENESFILCTLANPVVGNYKVVFDIQSTGNKNSDNDVLIPVYKIISDTQFEIGIKESDNSTQSVTIHMEIKKVNY